ncbi:hypothetical protein GCM10007416_35890 [Kroppenstedtia guangzhouensis]|uniref:Uncharacterized protein n=1 Tax=Kroppenstedtia guangzhouensis TaxID=1274356 RepID=A0ABQ1H7G1_9BACL|nr:hypothetical protein GCM10007416_35890 [Kroppenstedtia guangzhouensis]
MFWRSGYVKDLDLRYNTNPLSKGGDETISGMDGYEVNYVSSIGHSRFTSELTYHYSTNELEIVKPPMTQNT